MRAISKFIRTHKEIRDTLTEAPWVRLLSGHVEEFIDSICCAKVSHPSLACGVGLSYRVPSFHKWICINGTCNQCGIDVKHKISECDILMNNEQVIDLLEWKDIPRQGF